MNKKIMITILVQDDLDNAELDNSVRDVVDEIGELEGIDDFMIDSIIIEPYEPVK